MDRRRTGLPAGYRIERDAEVLAVLGPDGYVVARFNARGATDEAIRRTIDEDMEHRTGHQTRQTAHQAW